MTNNLPNRSRAENASAGRLRRAGVTVAITTSLVGVTSAAAAQEANGAERADTLFAEANALVERGQFADACPKFAESQRLDPAIGTQYNLALCYEKIDKLGSAFRNLRDVERLSHATGKKGREAAAQTKLAELRPRVAHLVIVAEHADVTVKVDGERVEREDFDFYAVDSGDHAVEATAPAKKPWRGRASVPERGSGVAVRVDVPKLEVDTRVITKEKLNTKRTIAYAAGGVGLVGVGVAAVTGIMILNDKSTAEEKCAPRCVDEVGRDAVTRGETLLPINAVAAAVGVVGLAAGAFLFLTSRSTSSTNAAPVAIRPYVGPGAAGLVGRF